MDRQLELKELHGKKREELHIKEVDTCLSKLSEINTRIEKGN